MCYAIGCAYLRFSDRRLYAFSFSCVQCAWGDCVGFVVGRPPAVRCEGALNIPDFRFSFKHFDVLNQNTQNKIPCNYKFSDFFTAGAIS